MWRGCACRGGFGDDVVELIVGDLGVCLRVMAFGLCLVQYFEGLRGVGTEMKGECVSE